MKFILNDGGRDAAGYKGETRDCVTRAIAIAAERSYQDIYDLINLTAGKSCARTGVPKAVTKKVMAILGWNWTPTMGIGTGCTVHLKSDELPAGRLVVSCSRHVVAVIDGELHDSHDSSREGTRCVYGYWRKA